MTAPDHMRPEMVAVVRWLLRNPDTFAIVKTLVNLEEGVNPATVEHEFAQRYISLGAVHWCPHCHDATVYFPDGKELDWPSLDKHQCPALNRGADRNFA